MGQISELPRDWHIGFGQKACEDEVSKNGSTIEIKKVGGRQNYILIWRMMGMTWGALGSVWAVGCKCLPAKKHQEHTCPQNTLGFITYCSQRTHGEPWGKGVGKKLLYDLGLG